MDKLIFSEIESAASVDVKHLYYNKLYNGASVLKGVHNTYSEVLLFFTYL